jgi:Zn ribbon nucleic-acid-binding protein
VTPATWEGDHVQNNSGDPFATKTLLDRATVYVFGVRDYFLGVIEREREEYEAAHRMVSTAPVVLRANDDCPECKTAGSMRSIAADVVRCFACGHQNEIRNPPGSPNRTQLESWQGFGRK